MNKIKKERAQSISLIEQDQPPLTEIHFYRSNEKPYGVFSNLFRRAIAFEGVEFPTAEHAYQAGKARKEAVRKWILSAPTPSLVAMACTRSLYMGHRSELVKNKIRSNARSPASQIHTTRGLANTAFVYWRAWLLNRAARTIQLQQDLGRSKGQGARARSACCSWKFGRS